VRRATLRNPAAASTPAVSTTPEAAHELRALDEAAARYPDTKRTLLPLTRDDLPPETPAGVTGTTAWEWMLARDTIG
jgi:hypothetical protein